MLVKSRLNGSQAADPAAALRHILRITMMHKKYLMQINYTGQRCEQPGCHSWHDENPDVGGKFDSDQEACLPARLR
jgi:hypothetical protein